ncbi:MHYT domain-containing protein [Antarctobacter heliothermus]|uniref:MHYT domain-containing protein, NO-binding membrane sensor n=1 Tax=Antarctobacter heliothermus TaxID=74033 RepID=A0A239EUW3_9RHOB|nr:MHYT domain-containing protein [Antarctobacter heliothermus]SNS48377.1 MHYT domain-containing protein, NO-binding membrane sensor [Antarctobacter heliothermus]
MLEFSHHPALVVASLAVALMAGFSGLAITRGASALPLARRKAVVAISAVALGGGIWSMHFVAMLGLQLPILFYYDGLVTLVSALIAILMVGLALLILHFRDRTPASLTLAGAIVGAGIVAMHYVGMSGMELCRPVYSVGGVVVALIAALALSIAAIWVAYGERTRGHILLGTLFFGVSVVAVHFIAMAGTGFVGLGGGSGAGPILSNEVLAMGVTLSSFAICGAFLLSGVTFFPVRVAAAPQEMPVTVAAEIEEPDPVPDVPGGRVSVPYEKEGRTQFLDAGAIAAVRAEGHYTLLYSGPDKLFCPWSISEAARRLEPAGLIRTHRSFLVNPAFVTEFRRTKDTGLCFFEAVASLPKVPVSRSRLSDVRQVLGV